MNGWLNREKENFFNLSQLEPKPLFENDVRICCGFESGLLIDELKNYLNKEFHAIFTSIYEDKTSLWNMGHSTESCNPYYVVPIISSQSTAAFRTLCAIKPEFKRSSFFHRDNFPSNQDELILRRYYDHYCSALIRAFWQVLEKKLFSSPFPNSKHAFFKVCFSSFYK